MSRFTEIIAHSRLWNSTRTLSKFGRTCRHSSIRAAEASFIGGRNRSCGLVGMPNVGKSTLFNALTNTQNAEAANFPFCTIKPNVGLVSIPDERLNHLAEMAGSKKIIGSQLEFVDIAGLVRGASKGAGLGNQFLGNIRQVSVILQLLRCFDDEENNMITHVDGSVDPIRDLDTIETELLLADLQTLTKKHDSLGSKKGSSRADAKEADNFRAFIDRVVKELDNGNPARILELTEDELYVCNVSEKDCAGGNRHTAAVEEALRAAPGGGKALVVCAKLEEEVSLMDESERRGMLETYGLTQTGLSRVIEESNRLLGLRTYYTIGPQEARAWSFPAGLLAPQAAGIIHTDFEKGFIKAETISYKDFVECGGEARAREAGKLRLEGKEYECQDGDIFHFRFN